MIIKSKIKKVLIYALIGIGLVGLSKFTCFNNKYDSYYSMEFDYNNFYALASVGKSNITKLCENEDLFGPCVFGEDKDKDGNFEVIEKINDTTVFGDRKFSDGHSLEKFANNDELKLIWEKSLERKEMFNSQRRYNKFK